MSSVHAATPTVSSRRRRRRSGGFTIVEVLLSLVALALAGTAVMQGVVISARAVDQAESCTIALEAARGLADRIAATPVDEVVGIWGPEGTEGPTFEVAGFADSTAATGRVTIVTDEAELDPELKQAFGMPRDLDGDGGTVTRDVSVGAQILPVLVEVSWGRTRDQRLRLPVVVVRR